MSNWKLWALDKRANTWAPLYEQGLSLRQIGKLYDADHKTVCRALESARVERRPSGGAWRRHEIWDMPEEEFARAYHAHPLHELATRWECSVRTIEQVAHVRELYKFEWEDGRHDRPPREEES